MVFARGGSWMKLAILDTPAGRYFYYHFLPLVKEDIEDAVLISREQLNSFKRKGFLVVSDDKNIADVWLLEFLKVETIYSFSLGDLKKFRSIINGATK